MPKAKIPTPLVIQRTDSKIDLKAFYCDKCLEELAREQLSSTSIKVLLIKPLKRNNTARGRTKSSHRSKKRRSSSMQ